jgi:hypothetical protein
MEIIKLASSVLKKHDGTFIHTIVFNCQGKNFESHVVETPHETYESYTYLMTRNGAKDIDIPKYFGEHSSEVYTFIYNNIQRGYTEE